MSETQQELEVNQKTITIPVPVFTSRMRIEAVIVGPEHDGCNETSIQLMNVSAENDAEAMINARADFQEYTEDWAEIEDIELGGCVNGEHLIFLRIPVSTVLLKLSMQTHKGTVEREMNMEQIAYARDLFKETVPEGDDYGAKYVLTDKGRAMLDELKRKGAMR